MTTRLRRDVLVPLLFFCIAALMVRCTGAPATSKYANGLTCRAYASSIVDNQPVTTGTDCRFKCPDGRELSLPDAVVSQPKDQLRYLFCGGPAPVATSAGTGTAEPQDLMALPTLVPPLSRLVEACDLVKGTITFSYIHPLPDLTNQKVGVDVQGQPLDCSPTAGHPDMLTCKLPPHVSFPTSVEFRLNDRIADLFAYSGGICSWGPTALPNPLATALAAPSSHPPTNAPPPSTHEPPAATHEPHATHAPHATHEPHATHRPKPTHMPVVIPMQVPVVIPSLYSCRGLLCPFVLSAILSSP